MMLWLRLDSMLSWWLPTRRCFMPVRMTSIMVRAWPQGTTFRPCLGACVEEGACYWSWERSPCEVEQACLKQPCCSLEQPGCSLEQPCSPQAALLQHTVNTHLHIEAVRRVPLDRQALLLEVDQVKHALIVDLDVRGLQAVARVLARRRLRALKRR